MVSDQEWQPLGDAKFLTEDVLVAAACSARNNHLSKSFPTITSKQEFGRIYSASKTVSTNVVLFSAPPIDKPLVAFVASKKVGGSVVRNRAKRLMRAALRSLVKSEDLKVTAILLARHSITKRPFTQIVTDLKYCLRKTAGSV